MIWTLVIIGTFRITQTDWVSGPGVVSAVTDWGKAFYDCDSITYNIQGQVSPVASGTVNYTNWVKHIIDSDGNIYNNSIVAADFDGNGSIDLCGWKGNGNILQFYKNDGDNNFTKVNSYAGPSTSQWGFIATDYFTNSGLPDIVAPGEGGGLSWYQNNGNFCFTAHSISSTAYYSVTTGDIDNNGNISIVAGGASGVGIYKNSGGGNFTLTQTFSVAAWRVRLDDMNNDGYKDLLVGNPWGGFIYIYLNNGNGTFPATPSATLSCYYVDGLWTRDFDNDGYEDILCGYMASGFNLYWYHNNGDGVNYTQHTVYAVGNMNYGDGAYAEDLDMDGNADVSSSFEYLGWFRQVGLDNFTEYQIDSYGAAYSHWVIPFKLNRGSCAKSGEVNLLVCYEGAFAWYENNMISQFAANSYLESSMLKSLCSDSGDVIDWLYFGYDVCNPSSGTLSFQFRTGNTTGQVRSAQWSTPVSSVTTTGPVEDSISLASLPTKGIFQYRINCKGGTDAPVVYKVWVTYQCGLAGVGEKKVSSPFSLQIKNNSISYSLPEKSNISISLYDVTGRLARTINKGEQEAGIYEVAIPGLKSGIYFVSFSYNGIKTTQKMVLLK